MPPNPALAREWNEDPRGRPSDLNNNGAAMPPSHPRRLGSEMKTLGGARLLRASLLQPLR
eukprot:9498519-Pyramimonas_sp.AAC.1